VGERFTSRHLGLAGDSAAHVRRVLGLGEGQRIMEKALPAPLRAGPPELPPPLSEAAAIERLAELAGLNTPGRPMIGLGYYRTITPSVLRRGIMENPSWYTAYTPYQPEISQGRLEALFVFQTMISELTGLPVANASLLDEATAAAEAMLLCHRVARGGRSRFALDVDVFPQVRAVLETRAEPLGIELVDFDPEAPDASALEGAAGLYIQYQGASGRLAGLGPAAEMAHGAGALLAVGADPLMLALVQSPGAAGADVAVGSTQRFGVPMGFGGPHAAYMAVRQQLVRQLPGRLVGLSRDAQGDPALRLALVTREQHIRRDKATSNVCTAQVLLAVMAAMYGVWHGPDGLRRIATGVNAAAEGLRKALDGIGHKTAAGPSVEVRPGPMFDTLAVRVPGRAEAVVEAANGLGLKLWLHDADTVYLSTDEATTTQDLVDVVNSFRAGCGLESAGGGDGEPDAVLAVLKEDRQIGAGLDAANFGSLGGCCPTPSACVDAGGAGLSPAETQQTNTVGAPGGLLPDRLPGGCCPTPSACVDAGGAGLSPAETQQADTVGAPGGLLSDRLPGQGPGLLHVDAYRLETLAQLDDLDLDTELEEAVTVVEWGMGMAEQLSQDRLEIQLDRARGAGGGEVRRATVRGVGERWRGVALP
jgi:glycine cleavage system pyridoxal-binding protein P